MCLIFCWGDTADILKEAVAFVDAFERKNSLKDLVDIFVSQVHKLTTFGQYSPKQYDGMLPH